MEIVKINPYVDWSMVIKIAEVYQITFGGYPWNEGWICPICKQTLELKCENKICSHCMIKNGWDIPLLQHWSIDRILTDFYSEMARENSICLVAIENQVILGFAWGYTLTSSEKTDQLLKASGFSKQAPETFFYLDEVAVAPAYQSHGIGKKLVKEIIRHQAKRVLVLRTLRNSPMQNLTLSLGGEIVFDVPQDRVIMQLSL